MSLKASRPRPHSPTRPPSSREREQMFGRTTEIEARWAREQFELDLRNGCLRPPGDVDSVVFEPEFDGDEWQW
jgi:hypothetical protein